MGPGSLCSLDLILSPFFNQTMRQLITLNVGGFAGAAILPACFVSPWLVLGCAGVVMISLGFMGQKYNVSKCDRSPH